MDEREAEEMTMPDDSGQKSKTENAGRSSSSGGHRRGNRHRGGSFSNNREQRRPERPDAFLNMDELRELFELIAASGLTDFELEREGFRVRLRRDFGPSESFAAAPSSSASLASSTLQTLPTTQTPQATADAPNTTSVTAEESERAAEAELFIITAPIVGTFYRASSPTTEPFIKVGSRVEDETVVCIIEAMKLMNEIQAEASGEVVKIYVENGQPVEYGQKLFGIRKQ